LLNLPRESLKRDTQISTRETQGVGATGKRARSSSILSFGHAQSALKEKHRALSKAGLDVVSVSDFRQAEELLQERGWNFSLLVVGPTVSDAERAALSNLYRKCCPNGDVIFFYNASITNVPGATALLIEQRSPENLLDAIAVLKNTKDQAQSGNVKRRKMRPTESRYSS